MISFLVAVALISFLFTMLVIVSPKPKNEIDPSKCGSCEVRSTCSMKLISGGE